MHKDQVPPPVKFTPDFAQVTDRLKAKPSMKMDGRCIFGIDPGQIAVLVDPLVNQVCRVNINSQCQRGPDTFPFTGRKDSAEGTLSVSDALRVFTIRTLVAAKETDANRAIIRSIVSNRSSTFLSTDFIL